MRLLAGAGGAVVWLGCRDAARAPARAQPPGPGPADAVAVAPISGRSMVAVARDDDHLAAVEAAIAAAGGLGFVGRGDRVLLKVNTNSGDPYPYSTSPAVVRWLARRLRDAGAEVTVGDRSFWGDGDTRGNFAANGIAAAARDASAALVAFEDDSTDWVRLPDSDLADWNGGVHLPRIAVEADHVIHLPCLKTHFITGCTLSLKNALGLVRAGDRARPGNLRSHDPDAIHLQIAQINRFVPVRLVILDAHRALVSGGPTPASGNASTFADTGVVIAGVDRVAIDATGIALLLEHAPSDEDLHLTTAWEQPTIVAAAALGLGARGPHDVELVGSPAALLATLAARLSLPTSQVRVAEG